MLQDTHREYAEDIGLEVESDADNWAIHAPATNMACAAEPSATRPPECDEPESIEKAIAEDALQSDSTAATPALMFEPEQPRTDEERDALRAIRHEEMGLEVGRRCPQLTPRPSSIDANKKLEQQCNRMMFGLVFAFCALVGLAVGAIGANNHEVLISWIDKAVTFNASAVIWVQGLRVDGPSLYFFMAAGVIGIGYVVYETITKRILPALDQANQID